MSADRFLTFSDGALWSIDQNGEATRVPATERLSSMTTLTHWASPRRRLNTPPSRDWTFGRTSDGDVLRMSPAGPMQEISREASPALNAAGETVLIDVVVENGVETLRLLQHGTEPTPIAQVNEAYAKIEFARPLPVRTPGAPEGYGESWLYSPPGGLLPGTPLIIVAYPGANVRPGGNPAEFYTMTNVQLLAGLGYAVLTPALPPTSGDGPAAHLTERIVATLDAALGQYPELDGSRVGYIGHSFGGYAGLVLATETQRIRSYVIMSTTANLAAGWGGFGSYLRQNPEFGLMMLRRNAGWSEAGQGGIGAPPWRAPEAYIDNSPPLRREPTRAVRLRQVRSRTPSKANEVALTCPAAAGLEREGRHLEDGPTRL